MKTLFPALVALLISFALPARAVEIPGQDSPAFQTALQDWLDGKDMTALTQLAELARQDNRAAQIFLARVAEETHLHAHVTGSLPRAERMALLRQPGGLSGKSWLKAAQVDVPLAMAILQSKNIRERERAGATLLEYGESTLALRLANTLMQNWQFSEARRILVLMDLSLGAVKVLMFSVVNKGAMGRPLFGPEEHRVQNHVDPVTGISVAAQLAVFPEPLRVFFEDKRYREFVLTGVMEVPELEPAISWCSAHCGRSVPQCVLAASFVGQGKYSPFSSPVESLLPNDVYWSSSRIEADIARSAPDLTHYGKYLRKYDACFVETVNAFQAQAR
ncbi:MAG: hypothetical protein HRU33_26910 [Rhodobacteraceae bacterium]|nr:hypothetical protein [Paracoccaceae bacterium]